MASAAASAWLGREAALLDRIGDPVARGVDAGQSADRAVLIDRGEARVIMRQAGDRLPLELGQGDHAVGVDSSDGLELETAVLKRQGPRRRPQLHPAVGAQITHMLRSRWTEHLECARLGGSRPSAERLRVPARPSVLP
jgi:hypothetical protein